MTKPKTPTVNKQFNTAKTPVLGERRLNIMAKTPTENAERKAAKTPMSISKARSAFAQSSVLQSATKKKHVNQTVSL